MSAGEYKDLALLVGLMWPKVEYRFGLSDEDEKVCEFLFPLEREWLEAALLELAQRYAKDHWGIDVNLSAL